MQETIHMLHLKIMHYFLHARQKLSVENADLGVVYSESFKNKAAPCSKTSDYLNLSSFIKNTKIVVPLKYWSNFWRSLGMLLINCNVFLELNRIEECILSSAGDHAKFKIKDVILKI